MPQVLLFHHALGQTAGFHEFAAGLRQAGHPVHAPDLFGGRRFDNIEAGLAYASNTRAELFLYAGDQHYFADSSLPSYHPEATAILRQRMLEFLQALA